MENLEKKGDKKEKITMNDNGGLLFLHRVKKKEVKEKLHQCPGQKQLITLSIHMTDVLFVP